MLTMAQSDVSALTFEVTDSMRARHAGTVATTVATVWKMWEDDGETERQPDLAARRIAAVESDLRVDSRPEWMHPLDAIAAVVSIDPDNLPSGELRVDYFDAWRTLEGLSRQARRLWLARCMGVSATHVAFYDPTVTPHDLSGPSFLYRYFDADGTLLYVGIAKDPDKRYGEHASAGARWVPYAASRTVAEYPDRESALAAERAAIRYEMPVYNRVGSRMADDAADRYEDSIAEAVAR